MKNTRLKKSVLRGAMVAAMMLMLTACGDTAGETTESSAASSQTQTTQESSVATVANAWDGKLDTLLGDWDEVCNENVYTDEDGDYRSYYYTDSNEYSYNRVTVYKEDDVLRMDICENMYEGSYAYGMKLIPSEGAIYDGCANSAWGATIQYGNSSKEGIHKVALISDNVLEIYTEYEYSDEDYSYKNTCVTTYLRVNSPEYENREEYKYKNNVTVSTVEEFVNALQSNTRITMKEGVYNLSEVEAYGDEGMGLFAYLENITIEAEENANVEICVDNGFDDVILLVSCNNVVLRGLTLGHHVEPGECDGDVIHMSYCYNVTIDKCSLYGSGAYGISADSSSYVDITNTDIYECTYGLMSLYNSSSVYCYDSNLRDTKGYGMICVYDSYYTGFYNCVFSGNECYGDSCLIENEEGNDVYLTGCTFRNNTYQYFSNYEVTYEECIFE